MGCILSKLQQRQESAAGREGVKNEAGEGVGGKDDKRHDLKMAPYKQESKARLHSSTGGGGKVKNPIVEAKGKDKEKTSDRVIADLTAFSVAARKGLSFLSSPSLDLSNLAAAAESLSSVISRVASVAPPPRTCLKLLVLHERRSPRRGSRASSEASDPPTRGPRSRPPR